MTQDTEHDEVLGSWQQAMLQALEHAIEHLQIVIFDESMDALAQSLGAEAALRESVTRYEQGLADLFGFVRASGVLPDAVAWSTLKSVQRRSALESGTEITLRTALESGMYAAEAHPLGEHHVFRRWSCAVTGMLAGRARSAAPLPATGGEEERLFWAVETLADLEEHAAFHGAVVDATGTLDAAERGAVRAAQERLLALPRYDLVLNAALLWLASHDVQDGVRP